MSFEAAIYGKYDGRISDYRLMKDKFTSTKNVNISEQANWVSLDFFIEWKAETLKELQQKFWKYFHGSVYTANGLWIFEKGRIKDNHTGNSWNVNSWGRYDRNWKGVGE